MTTPEVIDTLPTIDEPLHKQGWGSWHCGCGARVEQVCESCENGWLESGEEPTTCWRCDGTGWHACDDPENYDGKHGLIVVHCINPLWRRRVLAEREA